MADRRARTRTTVVDSATTDDRIIDELRQSFGRALDLDVAQLRSQVQRLESDKRSLRQHNQQLQQSVDLLRHIASDHERQLKELRALLAPAAARALQAEPHKE